MLVLRATSASVGKGGSSSSSAWPLSSGGGPAAVSAGEDQAPSPLKPAVKIPLFPKNPTAAGRRETPTHASPPPPPAPAFIPPAPARLNPKPSSRFCQTQRGARSFTSAPAFRRPVTRRAAPKADVRAPVEGSAAEPFRFLPPFLPAHLRSGTRPPLFLEFYFSSKRVLGVFSSPPRRDFAAVLRNHGEL